MSTTVIDPPTVAFDRAEYARRLGNVRTGMAERGLDALLLVDPRNLFYLTGVESQGAGHLQCLIVRPADAPALVTWDFEADGARLTSHLDDLDTYTWFEDPLACLVAAIQRRGLAAGRLGIERRARELSLATMDALERGLPDAELVDGSGIVEVARLTKSPAELAWIREAAAITDLAAEAGFAAMAVGARDTDVAAAISETAIRTGSEDVCWGPIVASGPRAGIMHTSFNGRTLRRGDTIFLELSGQVHRYVAPVMRTGVLGPPTGQQAAFRDAGLAAIEAIMATARAGVSVSEVVAAGERALAPIAGQLHFHHLFGYMVGIGFPPSWFEPLGFDLRADNHRPLEAGMVFHLPISLRKAGEWGVCQSQTVVITDRGVESLTTSEPGLREIADAP